MGSFLIVFGWLRCAGAFQVSVLDFSGLIDVYRSDLDEIASTLGSNDPTGTSRSIYEWLGELSVT